MSSDLSLDKASQQYQLQVMRHRLNEDVAGKVLRLFSWSVGLTAATVVLLSIADVVETWNHVMQPNERLVTEHVLMTLIVASVVQVGAASAAIVYGLFGKNEDSSSPEADEDA